MAWGAGNNNTGSGCLCGQAMVPPGLSNALAIPAEVEVFGHMPG